MIREGCEALSSLVGQLLARGATGTDIVAAGSVIVHQARLFAAFRDAVHAAHPLMTIHKLEVGPVEGAVFLARRASRQG